VKKFRLDSNWSLRVGMFVLYVALISKIAYAQSEHKISIQDKIMQEKQTEFVAVNALAPESVFSKPEAAEVLLQQMKLLARLMYEGGTKEPKDIIIPHEKLPSGQIPHRVLGVSRQLSRKNRSTNVNAVIGRPKINPKMETSGTQVRKISQENVQPQVTSNLSNQLMTHHDLQGTINTLSYERIEGRGVRFRYTQIPEDFIGHFWWFGPRDLRGKTVRIFYSGIVPSEITFFIRRSYWGVETRYTFHLEDSPETKILSFQIPDRIPFKEVSIFELRIAKSRAGKPYGDFLIEKVEVAPGDKASTPIEMGNQSHPFPFGGPYLQSNIWGGEVGAS